MLQHTVEHSDRIRPEDHHRLPLLEQVQALLIQSVPLLQQPPAHEQAQVELKQALTQRQLVQLKSLQVQPQEKAYHQKEDHHLYQVQSD